MIDIILRVIQAVFRTGLDVQSVIQKIQYKKKQTKGQVNSILHEVDFNMSLILEDYLKEEDKAENIINDLLIENLAKALDTGFQFNNIKEGKITKTMVGDVGFLEKYVGYNYESFLRNIRLHIEKLKRFSGRPIPEKTNIRQRLINLGKRYILLTKFLTS